MHHHPSPSTALRHLPLSNRQHAVTPVRSTTRYFTKDSLFPSGKLQLSVAVNMQAPFFLQLNFGEWRVNVLICMSGPDMTTGPCLASKIQWFIFQNIADLHPSLPRRSLLRQSEGSYRFGSLAPVPLKMAIIICRQSLISFQKTWKQQRYTLCCSPTIRSQEW